ncbi:MAG: RNA methyltransferase [Kofleriaceae bacterium]
MPPTIDQWIAARGPDAICAALESMVTPERIARIDLVLAARLTSVVTIVEDTYDPHNAVATIRTTEAIGLQELHVIEPHEETAFGVARGITRGADDWIDIKRWRDPIAPMAALRERGFKIYGTTPGGPHTIDDVDVTRPIAVAFGNEHAGLTPAALAACDEAIGIPMYGFTESFNLSVTVALAMSRIAARRRSAIGALGDLPDERRRELRARWFAHKIRNAAGILERVLADTP